MQKHPVILSAHRRVILSNAKDLRLTHIPLAVVKRVPQVSRFRPGCL
jgi:hypothetical protein